MNDTTNTGTTTRPALTAAEMRQVGGGVMPIYMDYDGIRGTMKPASSHSSVGGKVGFGDGNVRS